MKLDDLEKICDAATKGPWREDNDDILAFIESEGEECILIEGGFGFAQTEDYRFVAAARTEMPKLIDRARNLEAFVDFILRQERTRGYPTGTEWTSIVEVAKNEKARDK